MLTRYRKIPPVSTGAASHPQPTCGACPTKRRGNGPPGVQSPPPSVKSKPSCEIRLGRVGPTRNSPLSPALWLPAGRSILAYFFFVFFAAFGFAAAFDVVFDVVFFALRFAVIGMRECSLLRGQESAPRALKRNILSKVSVRRNWWCRPGKEATARPQESAGKITLSGNSPYTDDCRCGIGALSCPQAVPPNHPRIDSRESTTRDAASAAMASPALTPASPLRPVAQRSLVALHQLLPLQQPSSARPSLREKDSS